jgi:hypothetical protein
MIVSTGYSVIVDLTDDLGSYCCSRCFCSCGVAGEFIRERQRKQANEEDAR